MRQCVSLFMAQGLISSSIICKICSQIVPLGVFVHSTHNFWAALLKVYNPDENFCFFKLTPKEEFYHHSGATIALVSSCQVLANQLFVDKMLAIDKWFCNVWPCTGELLAQTTIFYHQFWWMSISYLGCTDPKLLLWSWIAIWQHI